MKKLLISVCLMLVSALSLAGPNDVQLTQRNATDTGVVPGGRLLPTPADGKDRIFYFNGATLVPGYLTLGAGLVSSGGTLNTAPVAWAAVTGKPAFAAVSGSGSYADLVNVPASFAPAPHTQAWSTITATPTTLAGYGIADAVTASALSSALASYSTNSQLSIVLASKFDKPSGTAAQYVRGDGAFAALDAYPASSNPAGYLSSITSTQVTNALGFTPLTTAGARGAISLTTTGSGAATYNSATGVLNVPTPPAVVARAKANVTKAVGACFQLSAARDAYVSYNVEIIASATLIGGARGTLYLETFTDSACTTGTEEVMRSTSGNTNALAVALGNVLTQTLNVHGYVMAGQYVKLRTVNDVGTPTFTARPGQEVLQ